MQRQFQYITDLAKQYNGYNENQSSLFDAINRLPKSTADEIFKEYGDPGLDFKPVNLLRAEIARLVLEDIQISEEVVNNVKEHIRNRDTAYFSTYSSKCLDGLTSYKTAKEKGDYFTAWNVHWRVFFVYFYRGLIKDTIRLYLNQIGLQLKSDLDLNDYELHTVDFFGTANFGSDYCWLALYPVLKYSHQDSYQFFLQIGTVPIAGRMAGHNVKKPIKDIINNVSDYQDILTCFNSLKSDIIKLNNESRNYFKYAPGSQAVEWNNFYKDGIAAVDYSSLNFGDISNVNSLKELNIIAGLPEDSGSNKTWNLWLFKTANIGDVVFATKGVNTCVGIGIIIDNYYYEKKVDGYNHRRKVKWITDKVYQYKSNTLPKYKNLFRPDTFSTTVVHEFILNEYVRNYPELQNVFIENDLLFETTESEILDLDNQMKGPKFLRFFNPLLKILNKVGEGKPSKITNLVIDEFNFTAKELEKKSKNDVPTIYNQIAWARNYLKEAGFISNEKRGFWSLTELGKNKSLTNQEAFELFKTIQLKMKKKIKVMLRMKKIIVIFRRIWLMSNL